MVKAALVLKHGQIPASLHFEKPSPHIDFAALKIRVPVALEEFPKYKRTADGRREFLWVWGFQFACDSHGAAVAPASDAFCFQRRTRVAADVICPLGGSTARIGFTVG